MARKKRRFNDGGEITDAPIEVKGRRNNVIIDPSQFDLSRIGRDSGGLPAALGGAGPMGGGPNQRLTDIGAPPMPAKSRMAVAPAVVRQAPSALGRLMGDRGATAYGGSFRMGLAKGGKADAHEPTGGKAKAKPVKKMAKGGSVSKRADGCAIKGKTKGKMV